MSNKVSNSEIAKGSVRYPVKRYQNLGIKPLLSIEEAAVLLGVARSTLYRGAKANRLPFPVYVIGSRLRVPRRSIERLIEGLDPLARETDGSDYEEDASDSSPVGSGFEAPSKRRPKCCAARRSSSGTASV